MKLKNFLIICKKNYWCEVSHLSLCKPALSVHLYRTIQKFNVVKVPQYWFKKQNRRNVDRKMGEGIFMKPASISFSVLKFTILLQVHYMSSSPTDMGIVPYINHLNPTRQVMHHQFNIQQLYALPTLYLCVLYLSENKQRLVPLTS